MTSWNETIHFCQWRGVTCGHRHKRVTTLMLGNNLGGIIPDIFGRLTNFNFLALDGNDLSGTIPSSVFNLSSLETFAVGLNYNLQGTFPSNLGNSCPSLQTFAISYNQFSGIIPVSISNASNLFELAIHKNQLRGEVPSLKNLHNLGFLCDLTNATGLQYLEINSNNFGGTLPQCVANLSYSLVYFYVGYNSIFGNIPNAMENLHNLESIWLSGNQFSGLIPPEIGRLPKLYECPNLVNLTLGGNNFTGIISPELIRLSSSYVHLDLSRNHLTGFLPMEYLDLQENFFQGTIPSNLSSLRGIETLSLARNNLSGTIPKFLENFTFLQSLNLSYNNLEGAGVEPNLETGNLSPFWAFWSLFFICCFEDPSSDSEKIPKVAYQSLLKATDGFSSANLIGMGSFGSVYKGLLDQGETTIAIKVLNHDRHGASKSFMAECEALKNIRHRNLVKVLSACSGFDHRGKRPTDDMFQGSSNLHNFVKAALPEQVLDIVDPILIQEKGEWEMCANQHLTEASTTIRMKFEESLISVLGVGMCRIRNKLRAYKMLD
ncbi:LRR receptor-like serine/threonine-protein kinase [Pyrus ussuriensis x Pyrus communis]|uniref:LRR receptor-like serine/threonine-protein kinase n=1 Tax=Pyrus ussuriensis x Pyrus communis TaxID=2448454 RepID=A0A5N5F4P1_9ROSA|nr:LRR receptor-like serine/threonine-protein kinase [Pyrus ussuriensis x Pyrus communis]